ncbi:MAG: DUF3108 domain-containing protein [Chloroflexi bacterium]|nr:DUF3108 domain-containing protein [Chloroflexota bacterium]
MRMRLMVALLVVLGTACATGGAGGGDTEDIVRSVPFGDGERLVYELVDADGAIVGRGVFTTTAQDDALGLVQIYEEIETPSGERPIIDVATVVVDATTLKPRISERTIQRREPSDDEWYLAHYESGDGEPQLVITRHSGERARARELKLREHHYDSQSSLWIWRTIDLAEGFEANYVSVNPRDASQVTARLVLVDRQTIEVPAGSFETWRLQVRNGRDTRIAWIHIEPPHEVVQWDNGTLFLRLVERGGP